jgi:hypothetical protein
LVADKAYDSKRFRDWLRSRKIKSRTYAVRACYV